MAKKQSFTIDELKGFLATTEASLNGLQREMVKRYDKAFFNEMVEFDRKAAVFQSEIKRLNGLISRRERKLLDEKESKS